MEEEGTSKMQVFILAVSLWLLLDEQSTAEAQLEEWRPLLPMSPSAGNYPTPDSRLRLQSGDLVSPFEARKPSSFHSVG